MYATSTGVKLFWQATGGGGRDLVLLPQCQPVTYSRQFKTQIPYLSRYFRVVTTDPRGNGRSDRPATGYDLDTRYRDLVAVLDEAVRPPFALVAVSCAAMLAFRYAVDHPGRVSHLVLLGGQYAESMPQPFEEKVAAVIRGDFAAYRQRLFARVIPEPHSLRGIEDGVAWAGETTPDVLVESLRAIDGADVLALLSRVSVPTLALHGTLDKIVPYRHAEKMVAAIPGARLVTFEGAGHNLHGRHAVKVNHLIRDFVLDRAVQARTIAPTAARRTPPARPRRTAARRVLWLSSPIGLGHIQRDLAMAAQLQRIHPDATVDFLTASPSDRAVEAWGARLHPASRLLHDESGHIEGWARDHELHAQNALWDMDEIMAANFMTFADVVEREDYDLWVGDEGWDLDYFLHENPELKRAPYVFLTDFIGVLPMREDRGSVEFRRAWDKNAENIDHLRQHPDVRDLSIMVGDEEDVLDREFGPDLPNMRQWAREHFRFSGYTYHFDPAHYADRAALRRELGHRDGERVILVSAGGTNVGRSLLRKCAAAFSLVAGRVPDTRMLLVAGPRLDPRELSGGPRIDVRAYVPHLFRHHAAADLAIVQGGLTTTMELAAFRTPFLYFPLRNHFEQHFHVARRLDRLGAGVRMDYDRTDPEELAAAILDHLGQPTPRWEAPVGGTERAARMIADLL
jgi:pimeloyl-ACP methyl ester carboxylesterase/UDP:flavonoid glycosyltransferase YjiC (YdhE family)